MDTLVDNLHRIHRVISRALRITVAHGEQFAEDGFRDVATRRGFIDYARCLVLLLRAHHDGEEQLLFPRLRGAVDDATLAELQSQHEELVMALDHARDATDRAEAGEPSSDWLDDLVSALAIIEPRWQQHLLTEERTATQAVFDALMSRDEQVALMRALSEHGQKHGHIPQLAVPFALYNLDAADRAALQRLIPPQVTQELMPGPWRAQWLPMQPFLLG